jgi:BlaI family transcriptional regulator, penicillinase repressor
LNSESGDLIMKQLTKAEEDIMQILWELGEGNVAAIIEELPEPKPAYNTVSTIVRILESKDFVDYRKEGRGHIYFTKVKKTEYSNQSINKLVDGYFHGSFKSMVSFFMKKNDISINELEAILKDINKGEE